jgi:hypothetical protein
MVDTGMLNVYFRLGRMVAMHSNWHRTGNSFGDAAQQNKETGIRQALFTRDATRPLEEGHMDQATGGQQNSATRYRDPGHAHEWCCMQHRAWMEQMSQQNCRFSVSIYGGFPRCP